MLQHVVTCLYLASLATKRVLLFCSPLESLQQRMTVAVLVGPSRSRVEGTLRASVTRETLT